MTSTHILASWDAVKAVFQTTPNCAPRLTEWIDLLRVVNTGKDGIKLNDLRGERSYGRTVKMVNRWQRAGLVWVWLDTEDRHPLNYKAPLRLRALPKAATFLRVTDPLPPVRETSPP